MKPMSFMIVVASWWEIGGSSTESILSQGFQPHKCLFQARFEQTQIESSWPRQRVRSNQP